MATKNIVPRADGEGKLGTTAKKWGEVNAGSVTVTNAISAGSVNSTGAVKATGITTRQNSTAYAVDDVAFSESLPGKLMLVCTTAGTTAPTEPDMSGAAVGGTVTDGTAVWTYMPLGTLTREVTPGINAVSGFQTSGTFTATVSGWYKITVKGGGGGGAGALWTNNIKAGGSGGGEGGTAIVYKYLKEGNTAEVVIGAGGSGGSGSTSTMQSGSGGGNTTVTIGASVYTGHGGGGGTGYGGTGGDGENGNLNIRGACGGCSVRAYAPGYDLSVFGGTGGGVGGWIYSASGIRGGGGGGGYAQDSSHVYSGGTGGNGYAIFEYFAS